MVLHPPGCGRVGHRRPHHTKGGPPSGPPLSCLPPHARARPRTHGTTDNHPPPPTRRPTPPPADAAAAGRQTTNTHRCSSVQDVRLTRYFTLVIAILSTASCALGERLTSIPGSTSGTADTFQDSRIKRPKPGSSFQVEIASYTGERHGPGCISGPGRRHVRSGPRASSQRRLPRLLRQRRCVGRLAS